MTDDMTSSSTEDRAAAGLTRRRVLLGLGLGAGAVAGGVAGAAAAGATTSTPLRRESLPFEVACLGELWREGGEGQPRRSAGVPRSITTATRPPPSRGLRLDSPRRGDVAWS